MTPASYQPSQEWRRHPCSRCHSGGSILAPNIRPSAVILRTHLRLSARVITLHNAQNNAVSVVMKSFI
ncbi:MAG TPA: hypothetical protein PLW02_12010 [Verrucomicrobiota bacterium]|nr:hypothetical protein [Verrucomicrobiota bacterium]